MTRVYLSVGSNIERERNLRSSVRQLNELFRPLTLSSVYQSQAVGFSGDDFYNMAIGFDTTSSVDDIHRSLRQIERAHGRRRHVGKFSARPIDIDLLLFGDMVQHTARFAIPRAEITQCAFVLLPLCEIAADLIHPETGQTIGDMWNNFDADDQPIQRIDFEFEFS